MLTKILYVARSDHKKTRSFTIDRCLMVLFVPFIPLLPAVVNAFAVMNINQASICLGAHKCNFLDIHVESMMVKDTQDVCTAGMAVATFFRNMELPMILPMCVTIVDSLPSGKGTNVLGCFTPESMEIRILSFSAASNCGLWFDRSMDRALYLSLAVHEIAHAFASCNASVEKLSVRASEYVAYVTMFATMDHDHRQKILEDMPGIGFENEEQISDTYYYLSPCQFGANAYRHFLRPENGARFFQLVIRGQALLESDN